MKNKGFIFILIGVAILSLLVTQGVLMLVQKSNNKIQTQSVAVQQIGSDIVASGTIHSQQEATLHFQTPGKLTYLPFKEGDSVSQGQTIAQLDTYPLQQALTQALNTYRSNRNTFDQAQANAQSGVLQGSQKNSLNLYNQSIIGGDAANTAINDAVKRIVDQNQANLDNSVISVQLANYAMQMATLPAPFSGVITHEDVTVANQNVTTATAFSLADPKQLVFRAEVSASDIDYVQIGARAIVRLNGSSQPITASVAKIYPQKISLPTGDVYEVDVQTDKALGVLGQSGNVIITSSAASTTVTVPTWTILGHNQIWVEEHGKAVLKTVTIGQVHGTVVEILHGLSTEDRVITNPATIASQTNAIL